MAQQSYKKFVASAATATLVASALIPVASANVTTSAFTDVPASYKDAVDFVVTNNISKGLTETQYGISQQIKRGDAAIMIAAAAGLVDKDAPASGFSDVPTRAAISINSLKAAGVVNGKSAKNFGFADNITRGEAALMLQKAFKLEAGDTKNSFTDVKDSYDAAVDALVANKVTNGINKTQFGTGNPIKRGDFAKFLFALEGKIVKLDVESLKANSTTSFDVMLKEALPADADLKELLKVKVVLKDGTIVTPKATNVTLSTDRKTITVEHKDNDLEGLAGTLTVNGKNLEFNYVKEEAGSLKVESVKAINLTDVTVAIEAPTEDLVDAVVVVKDAAGKVVPTKPVTIKAGATEATFSFVNPITVSPTSQWTVNGVAYAPAKLEIVDVDSVTPNGKYLEVLFNKPLKSLEASEISIRNSNTLVRVGVEKVKLASDGMSAQVTLLGSEDAKAIIDRLTSYDFTLTQNGTVTSKQFTLPGYITEQSVTAVDAKERTITIGNTTLNVPTTMAFDFEDALGREVAVWFDKNNNVTKFNVVDQTVKFDAVKFETRNGVSYVKLATEGKEYRLAANYNLLEKTSTGLKNGSLATNYKYAKLVLNNQGQVENIIAVPSFTSTLLVESVNGNIVKANTTEYNLKDYTVVKEGKTIALSDLKAGDVVYYNQSLKFAEVYNKVEAGKIEDVYKGQFKINGKVYDIAGSYVTADDYAGLDEDALEAFKAEGKTVSVFFDRDGKVQIVSGVMGEVVSNTSISYLTKDGKQYDFKGSDYLLLNTFTSKGEKVEENINVEGLSSVTNTTTLYKVGQDPVALSATTPAGKTNAIKGFKLTSTGGAAFTLDAVRKDNTLVPTGITIDNAGTDTLDAQQVMKVTKDDKGNVVGLTKQTALETGVNGVKVTDKTVGTAKSQIKSSTPVFVEVYEAPGFSTFKSVSATTFGELAKSIVDIDDVTVYGTATDVAYLVIKENKINQPTKYTEVETVINKINYTTDNSKVAYIELFENGVAKSYELDSANAITNTTFKAGDIVTAQINEKTGKLQGLAPATVEVTAGKIDTSDVTAVNTATGEVTLTNGDTYTKATSGVQVYEIVEVNGKDTVVARDFNYLATLKEDNALKLSYLNGNAKYFDTIVITKNKDVAGPGTPGTPGGSQYLTVANVTEGATSPLVLNVTGTTFTGNADTFVDVSGLPAGYTLGTVTRTNNNQLSIAITGSGDFDTDATATVTVYAGGLNGVTTTQTKQVKFVAVDETFTLTAGKLAGTPALGTLANGGTVDITDGTVKTVDAFKAKLTAKPATFAADDKVSLAIGADGTLTATMTDGVTLAGTTNGNYEVEIEGTGKYAGKKITVKFTVTANTTVGTITLK